MKLTCRICKGRLKGKHAEIDHFSWCVPWASLEDNFGKREYKKFMKWMAGQTCSPYGIYLDDLERYLNNKPVID